MPSETRVSMVEMPWRGTTHGGLVERPRRPRHHRGGQRDHQPLPAGKAQIGRHRERDRRVTQGHEQQGRHEETPAQRTDPFVNRVGIVGGALGTTGVLSRELGGIARGGDLGDEPLHRHVDREGGGGPLGGVVDAGLDPLQLVEALFDACRTGAAGHAADQQGHLRRLPKVRTGGRRHRSTLSEHVMTHRLAGSRPQAKFAVVADQGASRTRPNAWRLSM